MATYDFSKPNAATIIDEISDHIAKRAEQIENSINFIHNSHHSNEAEEKIIPKFSEHSSGAQREKLNSPRYDLMPARLVNDYYGSVAEHGLNKYAPRNWEKGLPQSQIAASLQRHLWAYMEGENLDPDSKLPHVGHILWNAVALLYNYHNNIEDDRIPVVKR